MFEQTPFIVPPYTALAEVYDRAGYADAAAGTVAQYIAYAQQLDWAGRRVLDLGCGTGQASLWLSQQGYRVAGIDNRPAMLAQAQATVDALQGELVHEAPDFVEMDIQALESPLGPVDLVVAVGGVFNAIHNLAALKTTFARVIQTLQPGRLFIFDMRTIRGLATEVGRGAEITTHYLEDGDDLTLTVRNRFSFETLSVTRHYIIWQRDDETWTRRDELHIERGYPVAAISAMLRQVGFEIIQVLDDAMEPLDPQADDSGRAVFVAAKPD